VGLGRPIEIQEVADPAPAAQDAIVEVAFCGICASDLHGIHGELPMPGPVPVTMGHEASGRIAAVGSEVPVWKEGDRVAVAAGKACLACPRCAAGAIEECLNPQIMGFHYDGGWAELVAIPWYALAAVPDAVPDEHAAIACDAVSTPYAAVVERGALRPGERVGIWGIGGLGTHGVQVARMAGASFVAAVDPLPEARERALALGADLAVDPADDVNGAIRDAGDGMGLDLALDMVGRNAVVRQAIPCLGRGGRIVLVGQSLEPLEAGPIVLLSVFGIGILGHLGIASATSNRCWR
jgi:D-arabinose 1-dehydrogenase-like Zn-dependent alcohol dehydrogenase